MGVASPASNVGSRSMPFSPPHFRQHKVMACQVRRKRNGTWMHEKWMGDNGSLGKEEVWTRKLNRRLSIFFTSRDDLVEFIWDKVATRRVLSKCADLPDSRIAPPVKAMSRNLIRTESVSTCYERFFIPQRRSFEGKSLLESKSGGGMRGIETTLFC